MRKRASQDFHKYEGITSIFSVPKARGRIYVEAKSLEPVRLICHGIMGVYISSVFVVPIVERVALLDGRGLSDSLIEVGTVVKIRNGRYKDDVGKIVEVSNAGNQYTVKLKSREPFPHGCNSKRSRSDSNKSSTEAEGGSPLKRQFPSRKEARQPPYLLTKYIAKGVVDKATEDFKFKDLDLHQCDEREEVGIAEELDESEVLEAGNKGDLDMDQESFLFRGHRYTRDGHILLRFWKDRLEQLRRKLIHDEAHATFNNSSSAHRSLPKFLSVGSNVWITGCSSAGATGTIVDISSSGTILVAIDKPQIPPVDVSMEELGPSNCVTDAIMTPRNPEANANGRTLVSEFEAKHVIRRFDIGDRVQVQTGPCAGVVGNIGYIDTSSGFGNSVLSIYFLDKRYPAKHMVRFLKLGGPSF